ncbi:hypothetical protein SERLADRAFT_457259 [Serpula lacrymans var. lacrymans S7.9]|uniref:Uncharacterized protein n=1 Tax=Serpula lacrymans var. lacrymans (strain S7.9) TaxID=578457 RepID=F8NHV1_SERL9|nr:uncharacterized protein SERLADRAFT_457259 [Serpula lacrymans var. lacrymans S7.9]EGO29461.1 hypothetical protein SERLADRAFT_457259 [Serpula lacrymans var. lacrymans S7.9]
MAILSKASVTCHRRLLRACPYSTARCTLADSFGAFHLPEVTPAKPVSTLDYQLSRQRNAEYHPWRSYVNANSIINGWIHNVESLSSGIAQEIHRWNSRELLRQL